MGYDERLAHCLRPEEIEGPGPEAWQSINSHLGTTATSIVDLAVQLGERRYGKVPTVADPFCGGGSIPFEAARLGLEAYGSDLNPVAALLTWSALNIVGGGPEAVTEVKASQSHA
jgi:adenine-specific DNA methylase